MRVGVWVTLLLAACASANPAFSNESTPATRTSVTYLESGGSRMGEVIRIQAGTVRVQHRIPSTARLRATLLEGVDASNRNVRYEWDRDGSFEVAVSGRYRHSVTGSMVGSGADRLTSTITYTPLPDSIRN